MTRTILSLDQGTTSSRAILFDDTGSIIRVAQEEFTQQYPQPGWVEHNPEQIWQSQLRVAQQVAEGSKDIGAIGIANQRETTIVWDRDSGEPVGNAIVWQDRRTAGLCDELKAEGFDSIILEKTGLVTDAYFSGTKVAWILDNVPGARAKAEAGKLAFGTVDSFLIWKLTGSRLHITDVSNASRTMLYDIFESRWSAPILARLNIPHSMLPEVVPSSMVYGETDPRLFGKPIPIAGIAGDQQAATFGNNCHGPGLAKNTYGTGCFMLVNTGATPVASRNRLLTTIAWQIDGSPINYALEGSIFVAGAAVQWLRDELKLVDNAAQTDAISRTIADTGGVYLVPAFVGLGAPYWDQYARGIIVGLTRGSGRAQVVRATLESIAYQSRDVLSAMQADSDLDLTRLRVDGGAAANDFLMQFQADILGIPVDRPVITETTALGAAYLAGLGVGLWSSQDQIAQHWRVEKTFEPKMTADQRDTLYNGWRRAVERAKAWAE